MGAVTVRGNDLTNFSVAATIKTPMIGFPGFEEEVSAVWDIDVSANSLISGKVVAKELRP